MRRSFILYTLVFILISTLGCVRQSGRRASKSKATVNKAYVERKGKTEQSERSENNTYDINNSKKFSGTEIFSKYNEAVFMVFTSDGYVAYQGSGFFVTSTGIGVSNYHVFEGTTVGFEVIKLINNQTYKIKEILAKSQENDYIIFQVESLGTNFKYIPIDFSDIQVGEKVYALGSPRGLENTFSSGEISQVRENNIIQINVPIDHGSSGGALINEHGNAVGITMGGYDDSSANLNFAVNINVLKKHFN